jgi:hypothetical protein
MTQSLCETEVLPRLEAKRADWLAEARAVARQLGRSGPVNINDVRRLCPLPPSIDPRVMGAVFNKSEWVCVGYKRSSRSTCHNRPIGTFVLRDPLKNL